MASKLFDVRLRALRRDRAFRQGPDSFLYERAFADILDRLSLVNRPFASCLLVGCSVADWPDRLRALVGSVEAVDPGPLFAAAAGGSCVEESSLDLGTQAFDLCVAVGTLDSSNDLAGSLARLRFSLRQDSLLIGAMMGGDSLPALRSAMRSADSIVGTASPRVHPRVDAGSLGALLAAAGFDQPVVDVDRVDVSYPSLRRLVADLRAMGATNILSERSLRPLGRAAAEAADSTFAALGNDGRTIERFELLHFAAWTPPADQG